MTNRGGNGRLTPSVKPGQTKPDLLSRVPFAVAVLWPESFPGDCSFGAALPSLNKAEKFGLSHDGHEGYVLLQSISAVIFKTRPAIVFV